mmetsp:Transcript_11365/g.20417  ORF Transcript_11365/g.20417 Transcript_11365/m.20417 type:complete len:85 (+) Transcript_11365:774-1028(+)
MATSGKLHRMATMHFFGNILSSPSPNGVGFSGTTLRNNHQQSVIFAVAARTIASLLLYYRGGSTTALCRKVHYQWRAWIYSYSY